MGFPVGRKVRDKSVEAYLERISDVPKFLRSNPVLVTNEMIELYLENYLKHLLSFVTLGMLLLPLLCQYERNSVLKFLETFESYRVEHCLRLCQEYGIIDAAAFLLERVGDVGTLGSAPLLALSGLDEKFIAIDTAVESLLHDAGREHFGTVSKKEVNDIREIWNACIGLCPRNTPRLDPEESESLWFQLLDLFCEPLLESLKDKKELESLGGQEDEKTCIVKWKISKFHKSAHILRKLLSQFIKEIVDWIHSRYSRRGLHMVVLPGVSYVVYAIAFSPRTLPVLAFEFSVAVMQPISSVNFRKKRCHMGAQLGCPVCMPKKKCLQIMD